jgi:hypothetical protein
VDVAADPGIPILRQNFSLKPMRTSEPLRQAHLVDLLLKVTDLGKRAALAARSAIRSPHTSAGSALPSLRIFYTPCPAR